MLQVREQNQHQTKVLTLTGQFNRNTTSGIQARILAAQETGCHHIILDFSGVTGIDSTGLGELFLWDQYCETTGPCSKPFRLGASLRDCPDLYV